MPHMNKIFELMMARQLKLVVSKTHSSGSNTENHTIERETTSANCLLVFTCAMVCEQLYTHTHWINVHNNSRNFNNSGYKKNCIETAVQIAFQSKVPFNKIFFTCWGLYKAILSLNKTNLFKRNICNYHTNCKVMSA